MRTLKMDDNSTQEERDEEYKSLEKEVKNNTWKITRFTIEGQYLYRILKYCSTQEIGDIQETVARGAEQLRPIQEGRMVHVLADMDRETGEEAGRIMTKKGDCTSITISPEMFLRIYLLVKQTVTSKDDMADIL